jgi:hypothetical protein
VLGDVLLVVNNALALHNCEPLLSVAAGF